MSADGDVSHRRYRRRILGWGAAALLVVFVAGATVTMTRVEDDLEGRVVRGLNEAGIVGVRVSFSGQDGMLTCTVPLDAPDGLASLGEVATAATAMRGVRSVEIAAGCTVVDEGHQDGTADGASEDGDSDAESVDAQSGDAQSGDAQSGDARSGDAQSGEARSGEAGATVAPSTDPVPSDQPPADQPPSDQPPADQPPADQTVLELIATDPQFSALHQAIVATGLASFADDGSTTLFAPSNEAFEALTADEAGRLNADPELLAAILEQHVVADALTIDAIDEGPLPTVAGSDIAVDRRPVPSGEEVTLHSAGTSAVVTDADLVMSDGIVHVVDGLLVPARLRLEPVDPQVESASRAAALQIDLDGLTSATEIGFAPGSVDVSFLSVPTLDRVAEAIIGRPGTTVVVRGHTDSGGTDLANLFVSAARADAVLEQLVARGVPSPRLRAEAMGAAEPVLVDGAEDPVASRRVDFLVESD